MTSAFIPYTCWNLSYSGNPNPSRRYSVLLTHRYALFLLENLNAEIPMGCFSSHTLYLNRSYLFSPMSIFFQKLTSFNIYTNPVLLTSYFEFSPGGNFVKTMVVFRETILARITDCLMKGGIKLWQKKE